MCGFTTRSSAISGLPASRSLGARERAEHARRVRDARRALERRGARAASLRCPSRSMKNRYSHGLPWIGRSWIDVRFTPSRANGSSSRCSAPGLVLAHREHDRGEVVAARRRRIAADHEEARGVVAAILDARTRSPRARRRSAASGARDRRGARILGGALRGDRRARRLDALDVGQAAVEPAPALRERLRVRRHAHDVLEPAAPARAGRARCAARISAQIGDVEARRARRASG